MLVDLLVGLLVPFPTVARVFSCKLHGFFTTIRASFSALPHGRLPSVVPERQEPRTASKWSVPVERATVLPCSLALHNPPIADTACFLNPCAGLEQQQRPGGGRRDEQGGGQAAAAAVITSALALPWRLAGAQRAR